jgi:hypothetical protein
LKPISELLPTLLKQIRGRHQQRPDLIIAAWPEIIGEKLAPMTEAVSFEKGVLFIKVKNSTLYSLLSQHEKKRLVKSLQERFLSVEIRDILFRIG